IHRPPRRLGRLDVARRAAPRSPARRGEEAVGDALLRAPARPTQGGARRRLPAMTAPPFSRRTAWDRSQTHFGRTVARARASGRPLVALTESNPTRCGLGDAALVALLGHPRGAAYAPAALGHPDARAAVAGYYADRGLDASPDRICLAASTS